MKFSKLFELGLSVLPLFSCGGGSGGGGVKPTPKVELFELKANTTISPSIYDIYSEFNKSDLKVTAIYTDFTKKELTEDDYTVSPSLPYVFTDDDVKTGKKFTISYQNKTADVNVTVKDLPILDFKTCSWDVLAKRCTLYEDGIITKEKFLSTVLENNVPCESLDEFIGKTRTVTINNQLHTVRIIDIEHDTIANSNKKALFTFEFQHLICDSNGNSLAYLWNDSGAPSNQDYLNSSIRYTLNGTGNNSGNDSILATVKGGTDFNNEYTNKTILSMFPSDLRDSIKVVNKTIGTTKDYIETSYNDKLFLLSGNEVGENHGYDRGYGKIYKYYNSIDATIESLRVKKPISNIQSKSSPEIPIESGQRCASEPVKNYAGWNEATDNSRGGLYWFNSPNSNFPRKVFNCTAGGAINSECVLNCYTLSIAPAFCL